MRENSLCFRRLVLVLRPVQGPGQGQGPVKGPLLREYRAGTSGNERLSETIGQYTSCGRRGYRHLAFYRHRLQKWRLGILHKRIPQDTRFLDEPLYSAQ